ncbi:hypothetical protein ADUPG1_009492, partial [Aduncisulcus paluster]
MDCVDASLINALGIKNGTFYRIPSPQPYSEHRKASPTHDLSRSGIGQSILSSHHRVGRRLQSSGKVGMSGRVDPKSLPPNRFNPEIDNEYLTKPYRNEQKEKRKREYMEKCRRDAEKFKFLSKPRYTSPLKIGSRSVRSRSSSSSTFRPHPITRSITPEFSRKPYLPDKAANPYVSRQYISPKKSVPAPPREKDVLRNSIVECENHLRHLKHLAEIQEDNETRKSIEQCSHAISQAKAASHMAASAIRHSFHPSSSTPYYYPSSPPVRSHSSYSGIPTHSKSFSPRSRSAQSMRPFPKQHRVPAHHHHETLSHPHANYSMSRSRVIHSPSPRVDRARGSDVDDVEIIRIPIPLPSPKIKLDSKPSQPPNVPVYSASFLEAQTEAIMREEEESKERRQEMQFKLQQKQNELRQRKQEMERMKRGCEQHGMRESARTRSHDPHHKLPVSSTDFTSS